MKNTEKTGRGRRMARTSKTLAQLATEKTEKQQQAAAPAEAPKRGRKPKAVVENVIGKQEQAAAPAPVAEKPKRRMARDKAQPSIGRQTQSNDAVGGGIGRQGEGASGLDAAAAEPLRGGTKQVLIQEMVMSGKPGRPQQEEDYPFSMLPPAVMVEGQIKGQSFFIPDSDSAEGKLAAARKRHKCLFWSRKSIEKVDGKGQPVSGLRIWRGTPELKEAAKR